MHPLARLDLEYLWHPFTQMRDWIRREPIVITEGRGPILRDALGRTYLDANSSIWTNLHGHNHPLINAAIRRQLQRIAHSSALGLANEPASLLAQRLVAAVNLSDDRTRGRPAGRQNAPALRRVFFSDDGSTALEVALKLTYEYARRTGRSSKPRFLSLAGGYHGDTVGAASLGHIRLFRHSWAGLFFKTDEIMAPYCYRCRFNSANPERMDARLYRRCSWECLEALEQRLRTRKRTAEPYAAFVFEPLIQGAAGMIAQPAGWLQKATDIAREHGALLIADEVMTGFGRTGIGAASSNSVQARPPARRASSRLQARLPLFACQHEAIMPDFMALAKGMTGGYLPMAATLTTSKVFDAFLGDYAEFKTFFHGHSYTANQLGAAASLASMDILETESSRRNRARLEHDLHDQLAGLWDHPQIGDIRQVGLIAGIELVKNWHTREPFDLRERAGARVCESMARRGVLTRPIGNVVVLMPPYCVTSAQMQRIAEELSRAITLTLRT